MNTNDSEPLAQSCARVVELAAEATAWIQDDTNAELVGAERRSLTKLMRDCGRRAMRLGQSARTRMSVSVFGPSQAGKSFLVSVLARPPGGRLVADYAGPGGRLDYISEINPEGEGESTGLVTRFTMVREATPDGFPIRLTLMSEADVVRTLVNSFFMDGDGSEPPPEPETLARHLDDYRARAGAVQPGMSGDDVLDIADYVSGSFGTLAYSSALKGFWEDAARIAPGLSTSDRADFFAVLWGGHDALTQTCARLYGALGRIGHAEEVFAGLDALVPREQSIIDVKTLRGLSAGTVDPPMQVCARDGRKLTLGRAELCALAAEMVLPMLEEPAPMFAQTDLLDFPGARNRFKRSLAVLLEDPEATVAELILRGKVAYLFDRYVAEQEITSMLLCVGPGNMETTELPALVQGWIHRTHGEGADQRAQTDCILFFVMTKFDTLLGESAADGGVTSRFQRRMESSLLEKFGQGSDAWIARWTPDEPFRNCFWLRNPNFYVEGLIDYEGEDREKREIRLRPDRAGRLSELKTGCLGAEAVQAHFADPEAAWDAAMQLNDGGVGYLTGALARVCKPDSKLAQLRGQLVPLTMQMAQALAPHHVSGDLEQRIADRQAAAHHVIDGLEATLERHRFGALMAALMVDPDAIEDRILRVPSSVRLQNAVATAAPTAPSAAAAASAPLPRSGRLLRPGRPLPPGGDSVAEAAVDNGSAGAAIPGDPVRSMTLEQFQAETAIETWIDQLKNFRDEGAQLAVWGFTPQQAGDLVSELIHMARRTGLARSIAEELVSVNYGPAVDRPAPAAAILCAERINSFVATLSNNALPEASRPKVPLDDTYGHGRPVFAARPTADDASGLPAEPRDAALEACTDWVFALEEMFTANARDVEGGERDIAQNMRLGRILDGLRKEEAG